MRTFKGSDLISVVYVNGQRDRVSPALLNALIAEGRIAQFERAEGWAEVGIQPIRWTGGAQYDGSDRRVTEKAAAEK